MKIDYRMTHVMFQQCACVDWIAGEYWIAEVHCQVYVIGLRLAWDQIGRSIVDDLC